MCSLCERLDESSKPVIVENDWNKISKTMAPTTLCMIIKIYSNIKGVADVVNGRPILKPRISFKILF